MMTPHVYLFAVLGASRSWEPEMVRESLAGDRRGGREPSPQELHTGVIL